MRGILCISLFLMTFWATAQDAHKYLRNGDAGYIDGDLNLAEEQYRKALEADPNSQKGTYNLGNTVYLQERLDEAIEHYSASAESADKEIKNRALHNLGNAHFLKQEYDKALEAYKGALRLSPDDEDTRKNLIRAIQQLQLQQQQQEQQQQKQENKEQEENEDQQQEQDQQQDQQQNDEQQEQQEQPQENQSQNSEQDQEQREQPRPEQERQELTKEEAKALLDIMENEEKKVQEKLRKATAKPNKSTKDW